MSQGQGATGGASEQGVAERVMRTVTPPYFGRPDAEMTVIGWAYFLGLVILLVPLLPFIVILWLGDKIAGALVRRGQRRSETR